MIEEMLRYNQQFVEEKKYERFITNKYPDKKIAILSCMDTRLTELLPAALGIKNGDVKIIKNAGAIISHPFGSVVRSLLVAIYELGVTEVMVIGYTDCGAKHMDSTQMIEAMLRRGIPAADIEAEFGILQGERAADKETAIIDVQYAGYLRRSLEQIEKAKRLEEKRLPPDIDYEKIGGLRLEARQKLAKIRPENLGQAGRISGVNPADIAVLMVYISNSSEK